MSRNQVLPYPKLLKLLIQLPGNSSKITRKESLKATTNYSSNRQLSVNTFVKILFTDYLRLPSILEIATLLNQVLNKFIKISPEVDHTSMNTEIQPKDKVSNLKRIRKLPKNVWALTVTSLLTDVSSEMIGNLLPLYLAGVLGVSTAIIGLIEGIAEASSSLLKIISGRISDRLGRRKSLTVLGYSISTLAKPFLVFASNWGIVLGVRFADRVGKGIRTAPRDALIADSTPPNNRGFAYGLHRAGDTFGAVLGLSIAILFIWLTQGWQSELNRNTFQTIVVLSFIPALLAVTILVIWTKDIPHVEKKRSPGKPKTGELGLGYRNFLIAVTLFTLGNSSDAFIILLAKERGLSVVGVLVMLLTFNLVYSVVATPAGALSDKIGRRRLLIIAWLFYAFIYLGFALTTRVWQIWSLFLLYGIYYGVSEGVSKAYVADLVLPRVRATAFGIFYAAIALAALPASLIAGILWQGLGSWSGFGPAGPFLFGALLAFLALIVLILAQIHAPTEFEN